MKHQHMCHSQKDRRGIKCQKDSIQWHKPNNQQMRNMQYRLMDMHYSWSKKCSNHSDNSDRYLAQDNSHKEVNIRYNSESQDNSHQHRLYKCNPMKKSRQCNQQDRLHIHLRPSNTKTGRQCKLNCWNMFGILLGRPSKYHSTGQQHYCITNSLDFGHTYRSWEDMTSTTPKSRIRRSLYDLYNTSSALVAQILITACQAAIRTDQTQIERSLIILSIRTRRLPECKESEYDDQHKVIIFYWSYVLQVIVKCNNQVNMPKVIDKYILEEKIGNGQFGEVYKGIHQETLQVVAIKTIRRDMIKGKFYQLLENEIKVLKTCDNPHIIKLYALKKTPHNYYLMLQYCNGGDMLAKIKQEGPLRQEEVIRYFCQILNAFQTLVNHKIMHRDFKLANILLHEGNIKIADFGFAKLMANEDYTSTMLGSPLNMAPEVLGNSKYNTKADIWSIGACIYEMIYGKPPYVASNMVDLLKLIKSKPLVLPSQPVICPELSDVLKKMLVADVKRRAEWTTLFNHPVTTYLSKRRRNQAQLQLAEDQSLMLNTSKCYLKNNLILTNVNEIKQNAAVNEYLVDIIRTGKKLPVKDEQHKEYHEQADNYSKVSRHNCKKILHYRNIYAFLASVADNIINKTLDQYHEVAAYVLVRKILATIEWLIEATSGPECGIPGIDNWKKYSKEDDFLQIRDYIEKERDVFSVFNHSLEPIIKRKALQGQYDADIKQLLGGHLKEVTYRKYLTMFLKKLAQKAAMLALNKGSLPEVKQQWKLLYHGLKIVQNEATFGTGDRQFDFKHFYEQFDTMEEEAMLLQVQKLLIDVQK